MSEIKRDYKNYYEIINLIGSGEYSTVYKVKVKGKEEYRSIKVINKEKIKSKNIKIDDKKISEILIKEVENMKICANNNINSVKFYEYFETEKEFIIVMELCDDNLKGLLNNKKYEVFNENELYYILIQLNNTFKIMSENKIVHRDLKLKNILIKYVNPEKTKYIVKIGNYGINKKIDCYTKMASSKIGEFDNTAQEKLKEEKYDYECDIWSLGTIIYMLFFKLYLYSEETCNNILFKIKFFGTKEIKKSGNDNLDNLINGLLSKDPKNRLTWEEYLNHPFFKNQPEFGKMKENKTNNKKKENEKNKTDKSDKINAENVDLKKYEKNYSEEGFWNKIKKYGTKIGAKPIYVILLLYYSLPKASFVDKALIVGSLGFLISPIDLLLDTIPVIGFMDDIAILMFCYHRVKSNIDDEIKNKAKNKFSSIFDNYTDEEIEKLID